MPLRVQWRPGPGWQHDTPRSVLAMLNALGRPPRRTSGIRRGGPVGEQPRLGSSILALRNRGGTGPGGAARWDLPHLAIGGRSAPPSPTRTGRAVGQAAAVHAPVERPKPRGSPCRPRDDVRRRHPDIRRRNNTDDWVRLDQLGLDGGHRQAAGVDRHHEHRIGRVLTGRRVAASADHQDARRHAWSARRSSPWCRDEGKSSPSRRAGGGTASWWGVGTRRRVGDREGHRLGFRRQHGQPTPPCWRTKTCAAMMNHKSRGITSMSSGPGRRSTPARCRSRCARPPPPPLLLRQVHAEEARGDQLIVKLGGFLVSAAHSGNRGTRSGPRSDAKL